ncbi:MmcQ/YjbR family DNA-binding protein [Streptomyces sp. ME01-24h]|nr:MmcQ/YjbR family DNA-binding protein [Streptomyces sp. ME19-03-3]MDX3354300.1 MmcQ/YjbR family DNA-binding protein [Streptomyces sp. ME01-24h]
MDADRLRDFCLGFNGAVEENPFPRDTEVTVFKVGGKIFAISALGGEPLQVSLKCDPDLAVRLRAEHAAIAPGWHLNKRHWNTVTLDGSLPDAMVCELVEDSYDLIVSKLPRAERLRLDWPGAAGDGAR